MESQISGFNVATLEPTETFRNIPAAGVQGKALLTLREQYLYHAIHIETTNLTVAEIVRCKVKLNDEVIYDMDGAFLDTLAQREGYTAFAAGGVLTIPFADTSMKNRDAEVLTALNLGSPDERGVIATRIEVELEINSADLVTLDPLIRVSQMLPDGPGVVRRIKQQTKSDLAVGTRNLIDGLYLPGQKSVTHQSIRRLWCGITKTSVDKGEIEINERSRDVWKQKTQDELSNKEGLTNFAGYVIFDTTIDGYGFAPYDLSNARQFSANLELNTAPASMDYYAEFLGRLA